jgi:hypothetical protein
MRSAKLGHKHHKPQAAANQQSGPSSRQADVLKVLINSRYRLAAGGWDGARRGRGGLPPKRADEVYEVARLAGNWKLAVPNSCPYLILCDSYLISRD